MGAKDSKSASQYAEKSDAQVDNAKSIDKRKTGTQKNRSQKFESKLSANAQEFVLPSGINVATEPGYSSTLQKDVPWVQFLRQKERERQSRTPGYIPNPVPKQPILLQTGEYFKLLKSTDGTNRQRKGKGIERSTLPPGLPLPAGRTAKPDISAAVDEIIQSRCKHGKPANIVSKENALLEIVKLFESKAPTSEVGNVKTDVAATPKAEDVASTQDDIMLDKLNRDEDLADPVYWSEDERAPRLPRLASAHKLGHRPRNDPATPGEYVMQDLDSELDKEVAKLLLNANRLGTRHKVFKTDPQVRYMVTGIKEVCRALKYGKVKCVFIAPDIEDSTSNGGVDDRLRDILGSAYKSDVPVVFSLSRVRMGMAFGKSLKMSVVGLLETKGMQEQFDNILSSAYQHRVSWMKRKLPQ